MNKTKIEWCDSTWNPVTGCLHGCEYCYARKIANRFKCSTEVFANKVEHSEMISSGIYEGTYRCAFPFGFKPTFYNERLVIPDNWKKGRNIFVCSMADLFGDWVPDEWIVEVMNACANAPQHNYLFLTKNPKRYSELVNNGLIISAPNMWYGSTATNSRMKRFVKPIRDNTKYNTFISIEPLTEKWDINPYGEFENTQWVIIGAETGNRKDKVVPEKEWIDEIVDQCDRTRTPIFMKDSLVPIIGEENMRREFPKEFKK
jgi:protein gp37